MFGWFKQAATSRGAIRATVGSPVAVAKTVIDSVEVLEPILRPLSPTAEEWTHPDLQEWPVGHSGELQETPVSSMPGELELQAVLLSPEEELTEGREEEGVLTEDERKMMEFWDSHNAETASYAAETQVYHTVTQGTVESGSGSAICGNLNPAPALCVWSGEDAWCGTHESCAPVGSVGVALKDADRTSQQLHGTQRFDLELCGNFHRKNDFPAAQHQAIEDFDRRDEFFRGSEDFAPPCQRCAMRIAKSWSRTVAHVDVPGNFLDRRSENQESPEVKIIQADAEKFCARDGTISAGNLGCATDFTEKGPLRGLPRGVGPSQDVSTVSESDLAQNPGELTTFEGRNCDFLEISSQKLVQNRPFEFF